MWTTPKEPTPSWAPRDHLPLRTEPFLVPRDLLLEAVEPSFDAAEANVTAIGSAAAEDDCSPPRLLFRFFDSGASSRSPREPEPELLAIASSPTMGWISSLINAIKCALMTFFAGFSRVRSNLSSIALQISRTVMFSLSAATKSSSAARKMLSSEGAETSSALSSSSTTSASRMESSLEREAAMLTAARLFSRLTTDSHSLSMEPSLSSSDSTTLALAFGLTFLRNALLDPDFFFGFAPTLLSSDS
mmetsp:Transcript_1015/g.2821  ORF Transcript_1015/g.2821 Transcript_1015/m.2821 type:complete len:246 (-) Transcript_1015:480-1217(-)